MAEYTVYALISTILYWSVQPCSRKGQPVMNADDGPSQQYVLLPHSEPTGNSSVPSSRSLKLKFIAFFFAAALLIGAAALWIASVMNIIPGPWDKVFFILYTLLAALIALYMLLFERKKG